MMLRTLWIRGRLFILGLGLVTSAIGGWVIVGGSNGATAAKAATRPETPGAAVVRTLPGGAGHYVLQRESNGSGYMAFIDPREIFPEYAISPAYRQGNLELARQLIAKKAGEIPVRITLGVPIDLSAARSLISEKGIKPETLITLGSDGHGDKASAGFNLTAYQSLDEAIAAVGQGLGELRDGNPGYTNGSVRFIAGSVPATSSQLGSLLEDPRIALVDVMEWEIRRDAREGLGIAPSERLHISIPSPYWNLK